MLDDDQKACGTYRFSPAGLAAPNGPWEQDRCVEPRIEEDSACVAHDYAIFKTEDLPLENSE